MGKSKIPYIDHVLNVLTGCSGTGCSVRENCYAQEMVRRFPAIHAGRYTRPDYDQDTPIVQENPFSTIVFHPDRLNEPLKRKKPTVYGVGFFGDWMDEQVEDWQIAKILTEAYYAPQHTYVFLTKQVKRMTDLFDSGDLDMDVGVNLLGGFGTDKELSQTRDEFLDWLFGPNVWLGTTVCTQADLWRVEELLKVPGKKWISYEPALERVWFGQDLYQFDLLAIGCESGSKRRPMPIEWAQDAVMQGITHGCKVYVKQLDINNKVSHNPAEWPEELRVRDLPWRKT